MYVRKNINYPDLGGRLSIRIPAVVRKTIELAAENEDKTITDVIRTGIIERFGPTA